MTSAVAMATAAPWHLGISATSVVRENLKTFSSLEFQLDNREQKSERRSVGGQ